MSSTSDISLSKLQMCAPPPSALHPDLPPELHVGGALQGDRQLGTGAPVSTYEWQGACLQPVINLSLQPGAGERPRVAPGAAGSWQLAAGSWQLAAKQYLVVQQ